MRKAIKIKALTIFIAWLVIFAHSIIPHNHLFENFQGCRELVHEIISDIDDCETHSKFENQPGEKNACHFSNFLFNQFNQDNILISTGRYSNFHPVIMTESVLVNESELFLYRPYYGSSSLRAPPSA